MRVVHIITGLKSGGAERLLYDRSHFTEHRMAVVTLATDGIFADKLRAEGVPVHCVGMSGNKDLRGLLRLTALLARMRPDVVHVHLYRSLLFGRLAARLAGVRAVVATEHSALPDRVEGRHAGTGVKALYRVAERLGSTTVAVSDETKQVLVDHWGIRPARVEVVPNGIDTARLAVEPGTRERVRGGHGIPGEAPLALAVGRLTPGKHIDDVVRAVARLPQVHLAVVGTGDQASELARLAEDLGAADRVHLVGEVGDVAPWYAASDVMVSASDVETYGLALVEAYAAGLPVVYTQSPAADDLTARHDDGRIRKVATGIDDLTDGVREALSLPAGPEHVSPELLRHIDYVDVNRRLDDLERRVAAR